MYDTWNTLLGNRSIQNVGNHLTVNRHPDGDIALTLYDTDILLITPGDILTLNTGGFSTVTTRSAMNGHLPKGIMVGVNQRLWSVIIGETSVPFRDGIQIQISPDGLHTVIGEAPAEEDSMVKAIQKFLDGLTLESVKEQLADTAGDCFDCVHELEAHLPAGERSLPIFAGKEVGGRLVKSDLPISNEHLRAHVEEPYCCAALLLLAFKSTGHNNPSAALAALTFGGGMKQVKRTLKTFLYKRLIPNAGA